MEWMVVAIVAISVGAGVANNFIKVRGANRRNDGQDKELTDLKAEVKKLAERVQVLERITVDGERQLSAEISKLR